MKPTLSLEDQLAQAQSKLKAAEAELTTLRGQGGEAPETGNGGVTGDESPAPAQASAPAQSSTPAPEASAPAPAQPAPEASAPAPAQPAPEASGISAIQTQVTALASEVSRISGSLAKLSTQLHTSDSETTPLAVTGSDNGAGGKNTDGLSGIELAAAEFEADTKALGLTK